VRRGALKSRTALHKSSAAHEHKLLLPRRLWCLALVLIGVLALFQAQRSLSMAQTRVIHLPSSKILLGPVPGNSQETNSFPTAIAIAPSGTYAAILNNGFGTQESGFEQSIAVLDLNTDQVVDFPDDRLGVGARQNYFLGLAFGSKGDTIYASVASFSDPIALQPGSTGNGIAVYAFENGSVKRKGFIKIRPQPIAPGKIGTVQSDAIPPSQAISYPAGLAVIPTQAGDQLLVADNFSDDVLLIDATTGAELRRYDLSGHPVIPGSFPYGITVTRDHRKAYCSLWNDSMVAELDLVNGGVSRKISVAAPATATSPGSHPTALLLSPDETRLYVTLANADAVAVVDTAVGKQLRLLSTHLPTQEYGGNCPDALAQSADGRWLFVANASSNALAVFDLEHFADREIRASGFVPTQWYPTALAVHDDELLVVAGKSIGSGPNAGPLPVIDTKDDKMKKSFDLWYLRQHQHPYILSLIHGSVARIRIPETLRVLSTLTRDVEQANLMQGRTWQIRFVTGANPIKHIVYVIKENRTYDQIFGDLTPGDADPSLCLFGEQITPNQHKLARQFGILDRFYCSGAGSSDGHVWSTAAITSDYTEKTSQLSEHSYDYEGQVANGFPLQEGLPDVDEPATGYIWGNLARHGLSHRNYGEFVLTHWCDLGWALGRGGNTTPLPPGITCSRQYVLHGERLPQNLGEPHGSTSPWLWPIPMIAENVPTKPELERNFDPHYPDFRLDYPDQLRADEFLNEFGQFVTARSTKHGKELPAFTILRLPLDHTLGTWPGFPTPSAAVADNDLALGRVVEAISHSPYWDDTAIFVLEDDASDGGDHVDAHRSIALVISKYSPGDKEHPFVDSSFYSTVSMIATMEALLGLPPMNNNDAQAPVMASLFSGAGQQPPFVADQRNSVNKLIYEMNLANAPGANESKEMDFSHADAVDPDELNAILWRARKGTAPAPRTSGHSSIRKNNP